MRSYRFSRSFLWAVCFFALYFSASTAKAAATAAFRVGVCLSLSGEFESYGRINLAGMRLFLDDYNARADTHKMELLVRDDKSDPDEAARIVAEFAGDGVPIVLGPVTSNIMLSMLQEAKKHGIVVLSPAATSRLIGKKGDWGFKVLPGDDYQGKALARFFRRHMGTERAAVIVNGHFEYGRLLHEAFRETYAAEGGTIVSEERYNWDLEAAKRPDFVPLLSRTLAKRPDVVLLPGYAKEAVEIIRQAERLPADVIFCGGDSWLNHHEIFQAGPRLADSYYIGGAEIYANTPSAKRFVELLDASDDPDLEPYSVNGYDVMMLVAEVIKSGALTPEAIRDTLYTMRSFPLAAGRLTYDEDFGTAKTLYIYHISQMNNDFYTEMVAEVEPAG